MTPDLASFVLGLFIGGALVWTLMRRHVIYWRGKWRRGDERW